GIRVILKDHEGVYQDFYLVYFTDFGQSSLDIFVYYFTKTTNWAEYLRVRQDINLRIMGLLESLDMEVAFPSRTVYLRSEGDDGVPSQPPQR
ncbi:MAG: mechanosensitive ion channel, partial [Candidatus Krumholzibacteria bacterium]|nr:mechanosensitive ion channel [Candidatus Krumholzibacteria bacterium]